MKNPSVNSIVERLRAHVNDRGGCFKDDEGNIVIPNGAWSMMLEAATIISELQGRISDLEVDLGNAKHSNNLMDEEMGEWKARALAAESSLSRIKEGTIEECARVAEDEIIWSHDPFEHAHAIASAIRSLGSTGGAKKTAESGHSDSSVNSRTE